MIIGIIVCLFLVGTTSYTMQTHGEQHSVNNEVKLMLIKYFGIDTVEKAWSNYGKEDAWKALYGVYQEENKPDEPNKKEMNKQAKL